MDWFNKYFVQPILYEQGYNLVNTATYAIISLIAIFCIYKIFSKLKIKINFKFLISLIPFILFGSFTRALVDNNYVPRTFWTIAPGIYLLTSGIFFSIMFLNYFIEKIIAKYFKLNYFKWQYNTFFIGIILLIIQYLKFHNNFSLTNLRILYLIIITFILLIFIFYFLFKKLNWKWISDKFGFSAFSAHLLDATATTLLLHFIGGWEKHPLPRFFIEHFSPFSFIPLKLVVIIPTIYLISEEIKDKQFRNFLLISIAVLGFGEALRNLISFIL